MADNTEVLEQMAMGLRSCIASQSVHEFVLMHLVTQLSATAGKPAEFKRDFIEGVGQTLRDQIKRSGRAGSTTAYDTLEYFESFRALFVDDGQAEMFQ